MTHDPETGEAGRMPAAIAQAIIAVKKQVKQLGVDEKNEHGGYKYVSVDKFYERIGPLMAEAGIALLIDETETEVQVTESTDRQGTPRKTPWLFAQYSLAFMHVDGEVSGGLRRSIAMPITGPQTYGAAQSYIEKQFLRQVFKIPTGEKDADEVAQGEDVPARARTAPPSTNGARQYPGRQQAAPAPSDAALEARAKVRQLQADIDGLGENAEEREQAIAMLADISTWLSVEQLVKKMREAAIAPADLNTTIDMLQVRAANRRRKLLGSDGLEAFDGR